MPTVAEFDSSFIATRTPEWRSANQGVITYQSERAELAAWRLGEQTLAASAKPFIEYRPYQVQRDAAASYAIQMSGAGTNLVRFDLRPGDTAAGGHRCELTGKPFKFLPGDVIRGAYAFVIEAGAKNASWCLIGQLHHDDASVGGSPPFAIEIDTDDTIFVGTRSSAGAYTERGRTALPITRGSWYSVSFRLKTGPGTTAGELDFTLRNAAGTSLISISLTGLNINYTDSTYDYWKFGIYGDTGVRMAMRYRNMSISGSDAGVLATAAMTPARTLPVPFLSDITAPSMAAAFGTVMTSAWTGDAADDDVAPGSFETMYDQSGNAVTWTEATSKPTRKFSASRYMIGGNFAGSGVRMLNAAKTLADLVNASSGYVACIAEITATPANDVQAVANNNPTIIGCSSGTRKWGLTTCDTLAGPPHHLQAFVVDATSEKVALKTSVLALNTVYFIEAEHDGALVRVRVNGGAWASTAAGPIADLTAALRLGHVGTSFVGNIYAIATWKTAPTTAERATMLARFNAIPSN